MAPTLQLGTNLYKFHLLSSGNTSATIDLSAEELVIFWVLFSRKQARRRAMQNHMKVSLNPFDLFILVALRNTEKEEDPNAEKE